MASLYYIAVGSEFLANSGKESNSRTVSALCLKYGIDFTGYCVVSDDIETLKDQVLTFSNKTDILLISGGLGSTIDDCTREAVSLALGKKIILDQEYYNLLRARFKKKKEKISPLMEKQASLIEGAVKVVNDYGSAIGFYFVYNSNRVIIVLPGVPVEFESMLIKALQDINSNVFPIFNQEKKVLSFNIFGLNEANIQERLNKYRALVNNLIIEAKFPEVKLSFFYHSNEEREAIKSFIQDAIGYDYIIGYRGESLPQALHLLLTEMNLSVFFAESCTGGLISSLVTQHSGASKYFKGGVVSYANEVKEKVLQVKRESLENFGAVSSIVAGEMAQGALVLGDSDLAVSVTGIAGPSGGSKNKPVGSFYIGLANKIDLYLFYGCYFGSREQVQLYATFSVFDLLRRFIAGLPFPSYLKNVKN